MKNVIMYLPILLLFSCGQQQSPEALDTDSPAYSLAVEISAILPQIDPEQDRVIIRMQDKKIGTHDVMREMRSVYGKNAGALTNLKPDQLKLQIERMAHDLAMERLLLDQINKEEVVLEQGALDSALGLHYKRAGSRSAFEKELKDREINFEYVKKDIKEGLLVDRLLDKVIFSSVPEPREEEIKALYQETNHDLVTFRHLLLSTRESTEEDARQKEILIKKIHQKAKSGGSFTSLVKEYSDVESSRATGGLYSDLQRGMMEATIESVAFTTPEGSVSDVFLTLDGFNLIKVESRKELSYNEFRNREFEMIYQKKKNQVYQAYMSRLKEEADFVFLGL